MHFSFRSKVDILFSMLVISSACLALLTISRLETHATDASFKLSTKPKIIHSSSTSSCGGWSIVPSPLGTNNVLFGVAATSTNDAWAVGYTSIGSIDETLTEHWDGTSWSIISSPNPGTAFNQLLAVSATSTSDAWAVGNSWYTVGTNKPTLIEHWDGTSWNVVPSPSAGSYNLLTGVTALSPSDVWAVGYFSNNNNPNQTLIEHWDGTSWSIISSPNTNTYDFLQGVTALSPSDVWAVGFSGYGITRQTLIEHWDGTSWGVVPSSNPDPKFNELLSITGVPGTSQLWAVGDYGRTGSTLTEHWDGTSWTEVPSPNPQPSRASYFQSVAALSENNIWAVGFYIRNYDRTLLEHWDGTQWTVVPSKPRHEYFRGVTHVPGTNQAWIVGQYENLITKTAGSLIEFYC